MQVWLAFRSKPRFSGEMSTDSPQDSPGAALQEAILAAGGFIAAAAALGITRQAIRQWEICPPLRVLGLEAASGVARHRLRPDIYPPPEAAQVALAGDDNTTCTHLQRAD